ncbi:hypothetical protein NLU13_8699 [Sarocladium strictum]|uniref:Uncharacterized protein n=1 Tax=Sarocladium strictum TaxID=5046 RepID=A0AA39GDD1_SARSR|nr:hypothetical protein NLU13_8699 [Sarocladium strictum]
MGDIFVWALGQAFPNVAATINVHLLDEDCAYQAYVQPIVRNFIWPYAMVPALRGVKKLVMTATDVRLIMRHPLPAAFIIVLMACFYMSLRFARARVASLINVLFHALFIASGVALVLFGAVVVWIFSKL